MKMNTVAREKIDENTQDVKLDITLTPYNANLNICMWDSANRDTVGS